MLLSLLGWYSLDSCFWTSAIVVSVLIQHNCMSKDLWLLLHPPWMAGKDWPSENSIHLEHWIAYLELGRGPSASCRESRFGAASGSACCGGRCACHCGQPASGWQTRWPLMVFWRSRLNSGVLGVPCWHRFALFAPAPIAFDILSSSFRQEIWQRNSSEVLEANEDLEICFYLKVVHHCARCRFDSSLD